MHYILASGSPTTMPPSGAVVMDIDEAIKITRALAAGQNRESGASFNASSLLRQPPIVKALNRGLGALVRLEKRERNQPSNAGRYWPREEDEQVCQDVRREIDFHEIAKSHHRTVGRRWRDWRSWERLQRQGSMLRIPH